MSGKYFFRGFFTTQVVEECDEKIPTLQQLLVKEW